MVAVSSNQADVGLVHKGQLSKLVRLEAGMFPSRENAKSALEIVQVVGRRLHQNDYLFLVEFLQSIHDTLHTEDVLLKEDRRKKHIKYRSK